MSTPNRQGLRPIGERELGGARPALRTGFALLMGAVIRAIHGFLWWAFGTAVCLAFAGPLAGAGVGLVLGAAWGLRRRGKVTLAGLLGWGVGGALAMALLQAQGGTVEWPLTGVLAWILSGAATMAVLRWMQGKNARESSLAQVLSGLVGVTLGWPLAALWAALLVASLATPWSWLLAAATTALLAEVLEQLADGAAASVREAVNAVFLAATLAGVAALLSPNGDPLGWVAAAAVLWLVGGFLYVAPERHSQAVCSVAISPDAQFAVSGSADDIVDLWSLSTGRLLAQDLKHSDTVCSVAFSPDGGFVLSGSADGTLRLMNLAGYKEAARFTGHTAEVFSVAYARNGQRLLSGSADHTVRLWDTLAKREVCCLSGHTAAVHSVAFAPSGRRAISASADGTVRLWSLEREQELGRLALGCEVHAVALAPDGKTAVTGDATGLRLWNLTKQQGLKELRRFAGPAGAVYCVAWSPDGKRVLAGGADGAVRLWDVASGALVASFQGRRKPVRAVAFAPDGRQALAGGDDGRLRLLSLPG